MKTAVLISLLTFLMATAAFAAATTNVSLDVKAMDLKHIAEEITKQTGAPIVVDPLAHGTLTANITGVELTKALDMVTKMTDVVWRKIQFAKKEDGKVQLDQLESTALALAQMPLVGFSVEDPGAKTSSFYAKDLATSPDVSGIHLPTGYSWTTVYVIMPAPTTDNSKATTTASKVKAVADLQAKAIAELAKMGPDDRQQVLKSQWMSMMVLPQDMRQELLTQQMQAISSLDPSISFQLRRDLREAMRATWQGGPGRGNN